MPDTPNIVLDCTPLRSPASRRGVGRYVRCLAEALTKNCVWRAECIQRRPRSGRLAEIAEIVPRTVERTVRANGAVWITPTAYHPVLPHSGPWVASILDVVPLDMEEYRKSGVKAKIMHALSAEATSIITLSEHARDRIVALLGVEAARISVAPLPALSLSGNSATAMVSLSDRFPALARLLQSKPVVAGLIDLGTADPRKRSSWFLSLGNALASAKSGLVLVGEGTDRLPTSWYNVLGLGRVSDSELQAVLSAATAFAYPSAYEGQGLPPLEAMALGTPVVCMNNTSLPEVVGRGGLLISETEGHPEQAWVAACLDIIHDGILQQDLAQLALAQGQQFTFERFQRQVQIAIAKAL